MAEVRLDLVNRALALLGAEPLTSLEDDSAEASAAKSVFDVTRRALFRLHPWRCLMKEAELAATVWDPGSSPMWLRRYELPNDYLRLESVHGTDRWELMNRYLFTDAEDVNILYIADEEDLGRVDALLLDVLSTRLAADMAQSIIESTAAVERLYGLYERKLMEARTANAQEGRPGRIVADQFYRARLGHYKPDLNPDLLRVGRIG